MTHIKPTHVNKLSLWLNCSTGRDRAGTGRRGAYGQALGTNARLVIFPSLPPLLFFFPHCDRCRVAKFIPNLIAVRQWTQCWIVYCFLWLLIKIQLLETVLVRALPFASIVSPDNKYCGSNGKFPSGNNH